MFRNYGGGCGSRELQLARQVVISGSVAGIKLAEERLKAAGARRVVPLPVSGAFHSPFMQPAQAEFAEAVENMTFTIPRCPVYQNVTAQPTTDPQLIKTNLIAQLTSSVRWTQSVERMVLMALRHFMSVDLVKFYRD